MSSSVEERVVKMRFDNEHFKEGVDETVKDLERLEKQVRNTDLDEAIGEVDTTPAQKGVEALSNSFSALEYVAKGALLRIGSLITDKFSKILTQASDLTIGQISKGWQKYAEKTTAVQTIMAATESTWELEAGVTTVSESVEGASEYLEAYNKALSSTDYYHKYVLGLNRISEALGVTVDSLESVMATAGETTTTTSRSITQIEYVEEQLNKLNAFTDETSYNFTDMTSNIGKFTAAGLGLSDSVIAMEGIANWAAVSGQNASAAARAMYNISQAMGTGAMKLQDWKSIENANMATKDFKETVIETAIAENVLSEESDGIYYNNKKLADSAEELVTGFNQTLSEGWFNKDVMMSVFTKYGEFGDMIIEVAEETNLTATRLLDITDRRGELSKKEWADYAEEAGLSVEELKELVDELASSDYDLGRKAFKAAQEAKTLTDAIDATKDAASTGWMNIFQSIFGNYEESKGTWTSFANWLYETLVEPLETIQKVLNKWNLTDSGQKKTLADTFGLTSDNVDMILKYGDESSGVWKTMALESLKAKDGLKEVDITAEQLEKRAEELKESFGEFQSVSRVIYGDFTGATESFAEEVGLTVDEVQSLIDKGDELTEEDWAGWSEKTGIAVEDLKTRINKLGEEMSGSDVFINALKQIGSVINSIKAPILKGIGEAFNIEISGQGLYDAVVAFRKFLNGLILSEEGSDNLTASVRYLASAFKPLISAVKAVASVLSPMLRLIRPAVELIFSVVSAIGSIVSSLISAIFPIEQIGETESKVTEKIQNGIDAIKEKMETVTEWITANTEKIASKVTAFVVAAKDKITSVIETIATFISGPLDKVRTFASGLFDNLKSFMPSMDQVRTVLENVWNTLKEYIPSMESISNLTTTIGQKATKVLTKIKNKFKSLLPTSDTFSTLGEGILQFFKNLGEKIQEVLDPFITGIIDVVSAVSPPLGRVIDKIIGWLKNLGKESEDTNEVLEKVRKIFSKFSDTIQSIVGSEGKVSDAFNGIETSVVDLKNKFIEFAKSDFGSKLLALIGTIGLVILVIKTFNSFKTGITNMTTSITNMATAIAGPVGGIVSAFKDITTAVKNVGTSITNFSKSIRDTSILVGLSILVFSLSSLAKSMVSLSEADPKAVAAMFIGMVLIVAELGAAVYLLGKYGKKLDPVAAITLGKTIQSLCLSLLLAALSLRILSNVNVKMGTIIGLIMVFAAMVGSLWLISKVQDRIKITTILSLGVLAAVLVGIALIFASLGKVKPQVLTKALTIVKDVTLIVAALAAMSALCGKNNKQFQSANRLSLAAVIAAFAVLILSIAYALEQLNGLTLEDGKVPQILIILGVIVAAIAGISFLIALKGGKLMDANKQLLGLALSIASIAAAMYLVVQAVKFLIREAGELFVTKDKLWAIAGIIGAIMVGLGVMSLALSWASKIMGENGKPKELAKAITNMIIPIVAIVGLILLLSKIEDFSFEKFLPQMQLIAAVMIALAAFALILGAATGLAGGKLKATPMIGIIIAIYAMVGLLLLLKKKVENFKDFAGVIQVIVAIAAVIAVIALVLGIAQKIAGGKIQILPLIAIVASLVVLSFVLLVIANANEGGQMLKAAIVLGILVVVMAVMAGLLILMARLQTDTTGAAKMEASAKGMLVMILALVVITAALAVLSNLPLAGMLVSMAALAVLLGLMTICMLKMTEAEGKDLNAAAKAMIIGAASLVLIGLAVSLLAKFDWKALIAPVVAIVLVMAALGLCLGLLANYGGGGDMLVAAGCMVAMAVSLVLIAASLAILAKYDPKTLLKNAAIMLGVILLLGVIVAALGALSAVTGTGAIILVVISVAALVLAAALVVLAYGLNLASSGLYSFITVLYTCNDMVTAVVENFWSFVALAGIIIALGIAGIAAGAGLIVMGLGGLVVGAALSLVAAAISSVVSSLALLAQGIALIIDLVKGSNVTSELEDFTGAVSESSEAIATASNATGDGSGWDFFSDIKSLLGNGESFDLSNLLSDKLDLSSMLGGLDASAITESLGGVFGEGVGDIDLSGGLTDAFANVDCQALMTNSGFGDNLTGAFSGLLSSNDGSENTSEFLSGVTSGTSKSSARSSGKEVGESVKSGVDSISLYNSGKNVVIGLCNGINSMVDLAKYSMQSIANAISGTFSVKLEINSPSRLFYRYGQYIDQGLCNGIDDGLDEVKKSTKSMSQILADTIENDYAQPVVRPVLDLSNVRAGASSIGSMLNATKLSASGYSAGGTDSAGAVSSGTVVNYTQNNYSPKALNRIDIYRSTKSQLAAAKSSLLRGGYAKQYAK